MIGQSLLYRIVEEICSKAKRENIPENFYHALGHPNGIGTGALLYFHPVHLTFKANAFYAKERVKREFMIYLMHLESVKTCLTALAISLGIRHASPFTFFPTSPSAQNKAKANLSSAMDALYKAHNVWQKSLFALQNSMFRNEFTFNYSPSETLEDLPPPSRKLHRHSSGI